MLADEMTSERRFYRAQAVARAKGIGRPVELSSIAKDIRLGQIHRPVSCSIVTAAFV